MTLGDVYKRQPFDEVNREYTGEEKRNRSRIGLKNRNGSMRGDR